MASEETQFQLVTFQLGNELYGVNIMDVKEIVRLQNVRVTKRFQSVPHRNSTFRNSAVSPAPANGRSSMK